MKKITYPDQFQQSFHPSPSPTIDRPIHARFPSNTTWGCNRCPLCRTIWTLLSTLSRLDVEKFRKKSFFWLKKFLTCFWIFLNDELGAQNDKLFELQAAGFVFIDFLNHLFEDLLVEGLTHQSENLSNGFGGDRAGLFAIEALEGFSQDFYEKEMREKLGFFFHTKKREMKNWPAYCQLFFVLWEMGGNLNSVTFTCVAIHHRTAANFTIFCVLASHSEAPKAINELHRRSRLASPLKISSMQNHISLSDC